jgi:hypothetical protein
MSRTGRCKTGAFDETSSSSYNVLQQGTFSISYVDGTKIRGDYITDTFGVGGANVPNTIMALAKSATEQDSVSDFQGIMGVGFETGESRYAQTGETYDNVITLLKKTGNINTLAYSLWLNDVDNGKGSILFGGVDTEKYHGELTILPIQPDARSNSVVSFTVVLDNFNVIGADNTNQYNKTNLQLPVILDSGTTLTYLPDSIAMDLYAGVGAVSSSTYGVVVPCDLINSPATFNFGFGNAGGPVIVAGIRQFVLPFPPDIPTPHFRTSGKAACRWGIQASQGKPNLFGDTFLRNAYVVYNLEGGEIGIANTNFNTTKSNVQEIVNANSLPGASSTALGVAAKQTATGLQQPPGFGTRTGTAGMTVTAATATFNLGATGGSSSNKKNDANSRTPDRSLLAIAIVVTAFSVLGVSAFKRRV